MLVADEYLRNRAPIAARNHFLAQLRVVLHIDFAELHLLLSQKTSGSLAVRTPVRDVQRHGGLSHLQLSLPPLAVFAPRRMFLYSAIQTPSQMLTLVEANLLNL